MIGYYSEKAAKVAGIILWTQPDGTTVKVTAVYDTDEEAEKGYHWDDKERIGPVVKFVRRLTRGSVGGM